MTSSVQIIKEQEEEAARIEAKKERFAKDPDSFIEIGELIMGAIRTPGLGAGVSVLVQGTKTELALAIVELQHTTFAHLSMLKMKAAQDGGRIIKPPKKGFMGAFGRKN